MNLGDFIKNFSHNNIIRLLYINKDSVHSHGHKQPGYSGMGHEIVLDNWDDVSMDWEVNKQKGKFRHYINNNVLGITTISFGSETKYPEALNIVIERLEHQPILNENR